MLTQIVIISGGFFIMFKMILSIDGMACSMCESHINDAIRRELDVKKVTSSHSKGETVIISESNIP